MDRHWHEYADTTNRRLNRHEGSMQNSVNATTEMRSELDHAAQRMAELEERLRARETEDAERRLQAGSPAPAAHPSSRPEKRGEEARAEPQAQPPQQAMPLRAPQPTGPRLWARLGNLGWGTPAQELQQRLGPALETAKIDLSTITAAHCIVGRGSAAEIHSAHEAAF